MCGIIGAFNYHKSNKTVNDDIQEQFQEQRNRGTEGFGSIFIDKDHKTKIKRATHEIKALIDLALNPSKMIIMHHRQPTNSDNRILQTHPILVENKKLLKYKYLVIHNGIITNTEEMKKIHEEEGYKYTTYIKKKNDKDKFEFNDSESLAIEIARYIENSKKVEKNPIIPEIKTEKPEIRTEGPAAFITLQIDTKTEKVKRIYFGRNTLSPLLIKTTKAQVRISSEELDGQEIKENILYSFGLNKFNLTKTKLTFKERTYAGYSGTPYHQTEYTSYNEEEEYDDEYYKSISNKCEDIEDTEDLNTKQDDILEEIKDELEEKNTKILEEFKEAITDKNTVFTSEVKDWATPLFKNMHKALNNAIEVHSLIAYEKNKTEYKETKEEKEKNTENTKNKILTLT